MTPLSRFNKAIGLAQDYLRRRDRQGVMISAAGWTDLAIAQIRRALSIANAMRDGARRSLCFRLLNWLRRPYAASARLRSTHDLHRRNRHEPPQLPQA